VGGNDPDVLLYDLEAGRARDPLGMPIRRVSALAFSPDGRMLATVGVDGVVRLWDLATGAELRRVGGSDDPLCRMVRQSTEDIVEVREGVGPHEWLTAGAVRPSESPSFLQRASARRHRRAQGGSPMLRSIRPKRATASLRND
jgi:WD40 repeat protein